jgi:hypothetical protein
MDRAFDHGALMQRSVGKAMQMVGNMADDGLAASEIAVALMVALRSMENRKETAGVSGVLRTLLTPS